MIRIRYTKKVMNFGEKGLRSIDFISRLLKHRKLSVVIFTVLAAIGGIAQFGVSVNYNMNHYLPVNAPSTTAIDVMDEEFSGSVANTRVMIEDVNIPEALNVKEQLYEIDGVLG